jgi:hypothetical protein
VATRRCLAAFQLRGLLDDQQVPWSLKEARLRLMFRALHEDGVNAQGLRGGNKRPAEHQGLYRAAVEAEHAGPARLWAAFKGHTGAASAASAIAAEEWGATAQARRGYEAKR